MTRILILGGSSQLAPVLIDSLAKTCELVVTSSTRSDRFRTRENVREVYFPRDEPRVLQQSIDGKWDALVSLVPITALPGILPALDDAQIGRFVALSTASVQTKANSRSVHENAFLEAVKTAETRFRTYCMEKSIAHVLLRPAMTYGGADNNVGFIRRMGRAFGFFPVVRDSGLRQPVHVDDVVTAIVNALARDAAIGNTYFLGGGEQITFEEMARRILHEDLGGRVVRVPAFCLSWALQLLALIPRFNYLDTDMVRRMREDHVFDNGPAQRDLDFSPRGFLRDLSSDARARSL